MLTVIQNHQLIATYDDASNLTPQLLGKSHVYSVPLGKLAVIFNAHDAQDSSSDADEESVAVLPNFSLSPPLRSDDTAGDGSINLWTLFDFDNQFLEPPSNPPGSSYQPNPPEPPLAGFLSPSEVGKSTSYVLLNETDPAVDQKALVTQDATPIRDRWLYPVVSAQKTTCRPDKSIVQFYAQILKTYPQMTLVKDQLPPIIHLWQLSATGSMPVPLANCFSLIRMWEGLSASSSQLVHETLQREMDRLFAEYHTYTDLDLLATLQALVLYAIMAFFSSSSPAVEGTSPITLATVKSLQEVAYRLATTGTTLLLPSEQPAAHILPTWEDWITVSAKRRTVLVLYCFDCIFNCAHNLPTFPCDKLKAMPAPAGKVLWSARDRETWERAYCAWLARWLDGPTTGSPGGCGLVGSGGFMMGELMRRKGGIRGGGGEERLLRWLSEVDEFGMMVMVVVHGASK